MTSGVAKSGFVIAVLAIIIAIGSVLFCTHLFYSMKREQSRVQTNLSSLKQSTQSEMTTLKNSRDTQLQKTLADVTYLIRLAHLQLSVGHDEQGALKTLMIAQNELANAPNALLNPLQMAISADIATIRATPVINVSKVFMDIGVVQQEIQSLSSIPTAPNVSLQKTIDAMKSANENTRWYHRILQSLAQLKTLFVIRHVDKTNTPLFSADLESSAKQNILMQLNMTQWALLNRNQTIYQSTLQTVSQWLQTYFGLSTAQNPILNQLAILEKNQIDEPSPSLTNTLTALSSVKTLVSEAPAPTTTTSPALQSPTQPPAPELPQPSKTPASTGVET